ALVVDEIHLLHAKFADFLLAKILALPTSRSPWTASPARPAAFTPRPAMTATAVPSATVSAAAVATTVTASAIPPRRCARRCCLFLFLCHTFHLSLEPRKQSQLNFSSLNSISKKKRSPIN